MQINPLEPIDVCLKYEASEVETFLVSISDEAIILKGKSYLPAKGILHFSAKFFQGQAGINRIDFEEEQFTYHLEIYTIHFEPGFLVNCRS